MITYEFISEEKNHLFYYHIGGNTVVYGYYGY